MTRRGFAVRAAGVVLVALAATTACDRAANDPRPTPSPSGGPTTAAASRGPLVAVISKSGGLQTFHVETETRTLSRGMTLIGPGPAAKAVSITMSGGTRPTICAVWAETSNTVMCYDPDQAVGRAIRTGGVGSPLRVALSASGQSIAWTAEREPGAEGFDPDLYFGRLTSDSVADVKRLAAKGGGATPDPEEEHLDRVNGLAWHGEDAILITAEADTDVNGDLYKVPVGSSASSGWLDATILRDSREKPPTGRFIYARIVSSTSTDQALLVQHGAGSEQGFGNDSRAVLVDLSSGRAVAVISVPLAGRNMPSVSGGDNGVLYQTVGAEGDVKTYWKNPSESGGDPLAGLPSDAEVVVAQP